MFPNHVKEKQDYITWNDQICNENVKDIINLNAYYLQNFFSKYMYIYIYICRVTNCSPNPDEIGYGPNKPNTINL